MSSASTMFEVGAEVLGYVGLVASWRRLAPNQSTKGVNYALLTIHQCADTDDGAHTPAASVTINSRAGLLALRAAIDEALKQPTTPTGGEQR